MIERNFVDNFYECLLNFYRIVEILLCKENSYNCVSFNYNGEQSEDRIQFIAHHSEKIIKVI